MTLRQTPINIVTEKKKVLLGLEGNNYIPVMASVAVSLFIFFLSPLKGFWANLIFSLLPSLLTISFILLFINKRPPCYLKDFIAKQILGIVSFNTSRRNLPISAAGDLTPYKKLELQEFLSKNRKK